MDAPTMVTRLSPMMSITSATVFVSGVRVKWGSTVGQSSSRLRRTHCSSALRLWYVTRGLSWRSTSPWRLKKSCRTQGGPAPDGWHLMRRAPDSSCVRVSNAGTLAQALRIVT